MVNEISFTLDYDQNVEDYLSREYPHIKGHTILKKSLDARGACKGRTPRFNFIVKIHLTNFIEKSEELPPMAQAFRIKPIIVGLGPAGIFCALRLLDHGVKSLILERGSDVRTRMRTIARFWRYGQLDIDTNVCYGAGGAGAFSDGKLFTRIKSPYLPYIMKKLVDFGAPAEVAYLANPHIGSNKLRKIIDRMITYLTENGCEVRYHSLVKGIKFSPQKSVTGVSLSNGECLEAENVILATGHSAREIYANLHEEKVALTAKDFAVGVRIEHRREYIDKIQLGKFADAPQLGSASYRLSFSGSYTFCMCPGGYVLSSGTEQKGIVTNGMSNSSRHSPWSNSALVVEVKPQHHFTHDIMGGIKFQQQIEHLAYLQSKEQANGRKIPVMFLEEFMQGKLTSKKILSASTPSGVFKCDLREILPSFVSEKLVIALEKFNSKIKGFALKSALLYAPETRTSAPLRILRDKNSLESLTHPGLYPCGEGAGYAGGITSSANDGIRVAVSLVKLSP